MDWYLIEDFIIVVGKHWLFYKQNIQKETEQFKKETILHKIKDHSK